MPQRRPPGAGGKGEANAKRCCPRCPPSGFPSPAEDVAESSLDLQALVVRRPAATFFLRMRGEAMARAGVFAGDILVVDRSLRPTARRLIVLAVAGELLVRRYLRAVASHQVIFIAAGDEVSEAIPLSDWQWERLPRAGGGVGCGHVCDPPGGYPA